MKDLNPLIIQVNQSLITLLKSLETNDWDRQTVAKKWKVKDVAAHLLDGNLRTLSIQRDRYFGEKPPSNPTYSELVSWLNQLNADWVQASKRLSPEVLILLLEVTNPLCESHYQSLHLAEEAIFSVAWAGENTSLNWKHVAREYTERWLHQQQIRAAIDDDYLLQATFYHPFLDTLMLALPHTFRAVESPVGTSIEIEIPTIDQLMTWSLTKNESGWEVLSHFTQQTENKVIIAGKSAWKLFSKSLRAEAIQDQISLSGDEKLGQKVLEMVSFMA